MVVRQPHGGQMTEDELQELVETVAEAHTGLSEVAFKLRRELTPKGPALRWRASKSQGGSSLCH